ncbi:MAG: bifunctional demethylmenaquinone methyltransferase/2-methoxy-6-polyprenyl-1,4-benzoquinol methylase UbiE [Sedimentisphaerales bacterium]|nr:bifunctional demethylmenaquinone methyltransferase/2-methoxy-6-polyprenyl-1,4-benzoquinol methylase UbiE [Sedimentisphaerales bacterium]
MHKALPTPGDVSRLADPAVGQMFNRIVPTYDLLNHLLSLGRDFAWRRKTAGLLDACQSLRIVDLATGTGDMLIALLRHRPNIAEATGVDIAENMLTACRQKLARRGLAHRAGLLRADATTTPFADDTFDAATMAFGIRNTSDASTTLREIHRILKPGGIALILEFSLPACPMIRWFYLRYLRGVVPFIGSLISGDRRAYRYLDESIEGFRQPQEFCHLMQEAGFRDVSLVPLTFGVASICKGSKGL